MKAFFKVGKVEPWRNRCGDVQQRNWRGLEFFTLLDSPSKSSVLFNSNSVFKSVPNLNLVITVSSCALAPNGARPAIGTVLSSKLYYSELSIKCLCMAMILSWGFGADGVIRNGRRNLMKSRGISSAKLYYMHGGSHTPIYWIITVIIMSYV